MIYACKIYMERMVKKHVLVENEVRSPMRDKRTGRDKVIQSIDYAEG